MQGIYTYIPETNHVIREYSVSAILSLLFMVPISLVPALALLYFYVSTFQSMCAAPNMAVFCSSFTPWFPGMLLMYFLNDFEMDPVAPIYYYYYYYYYYYFALWQYRLLNTRTISPLKNPSEREFDVSTRRYVPVNADVQQP